MVPLGSHDVIEQVNDNPELIRQSGMQCNLAVGSRMPADHRIENDANVEGTMASATVHDLDRKTRLQLVRLTCAFETESVGQFFRNGSDLCCGSYWYAR